MCGAFLRQSSRTSKKVRKEQSMKWVSLERSFLAGLVALFIAPGAWAQATASLRGTVTDSTGAVVVGAKVTLTNTGTNLAREGTTGSDGAYLFELVQPGTYKLAASNRGFATFTQTGIVLEVNQYGRLDVTLKLGQSTAVVAVTGNVLQVDTT